MTIYCDVEQCGYNEDGFCWADKLHLDSNGVCVTDSGNRFADDPDTDKAGREEAQA